MRAIRSAWKQIILCLISITIGIGTAEALDASNFRATGFLTPDWINTIINKTQIFMTNGNDEMNLRPGDDLLMFAAGNDTIHMKEGSDQIILGDDNDLLSLGKGTDVIAFNGGTGLISFGFGTWGDWFGEEYTDYIRCDTVEEGLTPVPSEIEVRADSVVLTANAGDIIIQLQP